MRSVLFPKTSRIPAAFQNSQVGPLCREGRAEHPLPSPPLGVMSPWLPGGGRGQGLTELWHHPRGSSVHVGALVGTSFLGTAPLALVLVLEASS